MKFYKHLLSKYSNFLILLSLLIFYFLIRLSGLFSIPVYLDEAIYVNWADMFRKSSDFAYLSMQDGKTPLFFWIVGIVMKFIKDPILSSRFVSVFSGGITLISVYWIAYQIFDKKTAILFSIIYTVIPFSSFLERMGIADSFFVSMGFLSISLSVYGSGKLILNKKPVITLLLSFFSAVFLFFSFLSKSSGKIFTYVLVLLLVIKLVENRKKIINIMVLFISSGIFYITYTELLRAFKTGAQRFILNIYDKEKLLSVSPKEFISNPITNLNLGSFNTISGYFTKYLTFPIIICFLIGIFFIIKKISINKIYILISSFFLFFSIYIASKTPASRYFLPAIPLFVLISAFGINCFTQNIKNIKIKIIIIFLLLFSSLFFNVNLSRGKMENLFTDQDRYYLFEGDLSGIGVEETIKTILQKLESNNVVLYADTFWGHPDYINVKINRLNHTNNSFGLKKTSIVSDSGIFKDILGYPKETKVLMFLSTTRNNIGEFYCLRNVFLNNKFMRYKMRNGTNEAAYLFERR